MMLGGRLPRKQKAKEYIKLLASKLDAVAEKIWVVVLEQYLSKKQNDYLPNGRLREVVALRELTEV